MFLASEAVGQKWIFLSQRMIDHEQRVTPGGFDSSGHLLKTEAKVIWRDPWDIFRAEKAAVINSKLNEDKGRQQGGHVFLEPLPCVPDRFAGNTPVIDLPLFRLGEVNLKQSGPALKNSHGFCRRNRITQTDDGAK